jgi:hypothetical protein
LAEKITLLGTVYYAPLRKREFSLIARAAFVKWVCVWANVFRNATLSKRIIWMNSKKPLVLDGKVRRTA